MAGAELDPIRTQQLECSRPLTVSFPVPSAPTLVSPNGSATPSSTFVWNASLYATLYYIVVHDSTGPRIVQWLRPEQVGCVSGTGVCSLVTGVALSSGAGTWQVIAWNPKGYSSWSPTMGFVVN